MGNARIVFSAMCFARTTLQVLRWMLDCAAGSPTGPDYVSTSTHRLACTCSHHEHDDPPGETSMRIKHFTLTAPTPRLRLRA